MDLPFGPVEEPLVFDSFTFEDVKAKQCVARVCKNICSGLVNDRGEKMYLTICVPCYNEHLDELMKTIHSLMENVEFMQRKARMYFDEVGKALENEFCHTIPVIVIIFDGIQSMSPSVKEWMQKNFPGTIDGLADAPGGPGLVDVRVASGKWWYYCDDTLPNDTTPAPEEDAQPSPERVVHDVSDEHIIYFNMTAIVKRSNHRKHNSHQWFFDGVCQGLDTSNSFAFLTDCGTTYCSDCLAKLFYELRLKKDLIGVTARQRVEAPNEFFHPCEDSPFSFLRGDHKASGDMQPCWKCKATYYMSPAPLQGFEFEATLIMNSAMFNIVEALPVMPGPCQLLNWQKMKEFRVVEEYFNLLFKGESDKRVPVLPPKLKRMDGVTRLTTSARSSSTSTSETTMPDRTEDFTLTEFLRVNMRLAEDRVLSFVCVFSTGFGTKWIPGATFYYQPEIYWSSLLTQRRRWLNGTFASFIFFFKSKRAKERIKGGMFDSHKVGKNIRLISALWALQLAQLVLVLLAPAVFGSASYIALLEMSNKWEWAFGWAQVDIRGPIRVAECWVFSFFAVYVVWMILSFRATKGIISETLCRALALGGFLVMVPVYLSVWWTVTQSGLDVINVLVIGSLGLPVLIALAQSATSAKLYLCYLPWFMVYIVFFLVFIPSYSFARLWDTTWGNRETGDDSAIKADMVTTMKTQTKIFIGVIAFVNCGAAWAFIGIFRLGYTAVLGFMLLVFLPMIIQMVFSFVFLFLAVPMRYLGLRPSTTAEHKMNQYNSLEDRESDIVEPRSTNPMIKMSSRLNQSAPEDLESGP